MSEIIDDASDDDSPMTLNAIEELRQRRTAKQSALILRQRELETEFEEIIKIETPSRVITIGMKRSFPQWLLCLCPLLLFVFLSVTKRTIFSIVVIVILCKIGIRAYFSRTREITFDIWGIIVLVLLTGSFALHILFVVHDVVIKQDI